LRCKKNNYTWFGWESVAILVQQHAQSCGAIEQVTKATDTSERRFFRLLTKENGCLFCEQTAIRVAVYEMPPDARKQQIRHAALTVRQPTLRLL
jgi:hypothetical protein